jgi:hypothetical protein
MTPRADRSHRLAQDCPQFGWLGAALVIQIDLVVMPARLEPVIGQVCPMETLQRGSLVVVRPNVQDLHASPRDSIVAAYSGAVFGSPLPSRARYLIAGTSTTLKSLAPGA